MARYVDMFRSVETMTETKMGAAVTHLVTIAKRQGYHSIAVILAGTLGYPNMAESTGPELDWVDVPWLAFYDVTPDNREVSWSMERMLAQYDPFHML